MTLPQPPRPLAPSRGFALLESMVALVVVGVSLLALAATYVKLVRGSDVARQRGQATRLAQERMEQLRGFTSLDGSVAGLSWSALADGSDKSVDNATFARSWQLGGASADPMRRVSVQVAWVDRQGETQNVLLHSVIARVDPADVGALGFPLPANTTLKRPKNRSLDIPLPASDLGNGESAFRLPGTSLAVVFSNDSGWVVRRCDLASADDTITLAELSNCTSANAYLVAGHLSLSGSGSLAFPSGLAVNTAALTGTTGSTCTVTTATDPNTGATLSSWRYYLCVINVSQAGGAWSGAVRLAAPTLASGAAGLQVCRFQYPAASGITDNQRNVQPYAAVAESLLGQNLLLTNASSCPTVDGLATTLHQDCRSTSATLSADCPGGS